MSTLIAQLTNPAVGPLSKTSGNSGAVGASVLGRYAAILIQTALVLGGLAVLAYMIIGAIGWITAGGDKGKVESARNQIVQSIIGLAVLFSVTAVAAWIGPIFGLNLLQPAFSNQIGGGGSSSGGGGSSSAVGRPTESYVDDFKESDLQTGPSSIWDRPRIQ